jgi:Cytochrome c554 and c-prime
LAPAMPKVPNSAILRLALCATLLPAMVLCAGPADRESGAAGKSDSSTASSSATAPSVDVKDTASLYEGPGSCSSTSCHGSVKPIAGSRILQNEYSTWIIKDKHARAYDVLTDKLGVRIGQILREKLHGKESKDAKECLLCHALYTTEAQRARSFEIREGVTCENCHGPSSAWLGPHTETKWNHADSVNHLHMVDTRNVIVRTQKCLECHLGTEEKFVDHEMIAAGHPDLYFELDSFSVDMPRHWKVPREVPAGHPDEDGTWVGVRDWSTGQAVQLSADMKRLTWRAKKDLWPEFSELSCFACHHSLGPALESWREERMRQDRTGGKHEEYRPGDPAWNNSRYVVFRLLARQIDSGSAEQLEKHLMMVSKEMGKLTPDRKTVIDAATAAEPIAMRFAERLENMQYNRELTLRMMQRISEDAEMIANSDERSAEQATMAMASFYTAYSKEAKPANSAEVLAAINELFRQFEMQTQSAYSAERFAGSLRRIGGMIR